MRNKVPVANKWNKYTKRLTVKSKTCIYRRFNQRKQPEPTEGLGASNTSRKMILFNHYKCECFLRDFSFVNHSQRKHMKVNHTGEHWRETRRASKTKSEQWSLYSAKTSMRGHEFLFCLGIFRTWMSIPPGRAAYPTCWCWTPCLQQMAAGTWKPSWNLYHALSEERETHQKINSKKLRSKQIWLSQICLRWGFSPLTKRT